MRLEQFKEFIMENLLTKIARESLEINSDIWVRFNDRNNTRIDDFDLYTFEQVWGSTALGFGGIGGQAMTPARTYVFIPNVDGEDYIVYFAGRFAYKASINSEKFREDMRKGHLEPVYRSGKYRVDEVTDGN
jgi:hypothetical protein